MSWFNTSYLSKKQITLLHSQVSGGSDLSNFPVVISMTDANLKSSANGGLVQNSSGFDIIFVDSTETTQLNHEIENYVASTGEIEMWVNIPTLSASSDTAIYMYFNNSSISTSQEHVTSVWDSNHKTVYHLKEATGTNPADSTSNANNATQNASPTQTTGQIDGCLAFDQSSLQYLSISGTSANITGDKTLEFWIRPTTFANQGGISQRAIFNNIDGTNAYQLNTDPTNGFIWAVNDSSGQNITSNNTTTTTGIWYHIVGTYTASSHTVALYINGSSAANNGGATSTGTGSTGFTIGRRAGGNGYLTARLDEIRISNIVRSAGWITTSYNSQNSPSTFFSVGSLVDLLTVPSESVSLSESVLTAVLNSMSAPAEAVQLSESLSQTGQPTLTDSVSLSEALSQTGQPTLTDSVSLSEALSQQGSTQFTDAASLSESLSQTGQPTITDAVSLNETLSAMQGSTAIGSYLNKKQITILHSQVSGGSDLSNFPVLISMTDANLKSSGNGGFVQNSNGFDIIFMDSTETTKLDHEIENYVSTTGEIEMWVRIPTLSVSSDTAIYMYFNNSSIFSSQENKTGVWDSSHKTIYHLKEATGTNPADSTSNANNATQNASPTQVSGKIDGALSFDQASLQYLSISGTAANITGDKTIAFWVNPATFATQGGLSQRAVFNNIDGTNVYQAVLDPTAGFIWAVNDSAGQHITSNNTTTTTSIWYYVVGTYTASSNSVALYINGSSAANNGGASSTGTGSTGFTIGRRAGGNGYLTGKLDEIRISNIVRSAGWITTSYNSQNSPSTFFSVGALVSLSNPESATLSDSLALVGQPTIIDAVPLSESPALQGSSTLASESVSLEEDLSQTGQPTLTDSVSMSETITAMLGSTALTDAAQLEEDLSLLGSAQISAESVTLSDILSAMQGLVTLTDSVSMSEALALFGSSTLNAESVTLSDSLSQQGQPTLTDSVSMSETITAMQGSTQLTDSASLSESPALQGSSTLASESVVLSDTLSQMGQPTLTDSVSASETITAMQGSTQLTDLTQISDVLSLLGSSTLNAESVSLSDTLFQTGQPTMTESVSLNEALSAMQGSATIIDTASLSEALSLFGASALASESVSLEEDLSQRGQPTLADSVSVSEALSAMQGSTSLTESVNLSESSLFSGQTQIIEIAQLSDNVILLGLMQETAESVQFSDAVVAFLTINRLILPSESVNVSDVVVLFGYERVAFKVSLPSGAFKVSRPS